MTVSVPTGSELENGIHILKEEAEVLRSIKDELSKENNFLKLDKEHLQHLKMRSEMQQAANLYRLRKLEFKASCLETDKLSSSMIEDISTFDTEILSANETILLKMYDISEYERKQYMNVIRRLAASLQESVADFRRLESKLQVIQDKSKASDTELRQQHDKLHSEKSKLKEMLKNAKDGILEAQAVDAQSKERIYELETEVDILKQQLKEYQGKKLEKRVQVLETRLEDSSRRNSELQKQLEHLLGVEVEKSKLQAELEKIKSKHRQTVNESIDRVKSALAGCDNLLKRRTSKLKNKTYLNEGSHDENQEFQPDEDILNEGVSDDSETVSKLKDPNWSDLDKIEAREKTTRKRKQKQPELDLVSGNRFICKSNQPRKLFAERAKSKMFTNSPGLSSVDHPFTDMLQLSGSVASIKDKNKRSRTRASQKLEISQQSQ